MNKIIKKSLYIISITILLYLSYFIYSILSVSFIFNYEEKIKSTLNDLSIELNNKKEIYAGTKNTFENNFDFIKNHESIPKNFKGNIFVIMDDFMYHTHGYEVVSNFEEKFKLEKDDAIIYLQAYYLNQNIVQILDLDQSKDLNKKYQQIFDNYLIRPDLNNNKVFRYKEFILYLKEINPKANIVISQSFSMNEVKKDNIELLKHNIKIGSALPYKYEPQNYKDILKNVNKSKYDLLTLEKIKEYNYELFINKINFNIIELFYNDDNSKNINKQLYVCKYKDFTPIFSDNYICADKDYETTSLATPIITFNHFKK